MHLASLPISCRREATGAKWRKRLFELGHGAYHMVELRSSEHELEAAKGYNKWKSDILKDLVDHRQQQNLLNCESKIEVSKEVLKIFSGLSLELGITQSAQATLGF